MRILFLILFFLIGCSKPFDVKNNINLEKLVKLHNKERLKLGLKELEEDKNLKNYASNHANFMLNKNKLKHSSIIDVLKFDFDLAGENIAYNQETEEEVMRSWMRSQGHRGNILNKHYDSIGCGIAYNEKNIYWCVVFGRKFK